MFDILDFVDAVRIGGGNQQARHYLDYTVNGRALRTIIEPGDNIGLFGWLQPDVEVARARWLLLREMSELPSRRVPLYICAECGDLGCQTLSIRVLEEHDRFVWTEFAYEANYDRGPAAAFLEVGPFSFERRAYQAAIGRFAA